jgi:hypothetical protein
LIIFLAPLINPLTGVRGLSMESPNPPPRAEAIVGIWKMTIRREVVTANNCKATEIMF